MLKYIATGHRGVMIHATPGEKGHPSMPFQQYEAIKLEEARRTAEVWGADVRFMPYKDAGLPYSPKVVMELAAIFREIRPDIVLTHWRGSFHPDHFKTHCLTMDAVLACGADQPVADLSPWQVRQVFFAENWEDMTGFRPELFSDVSSVYPQWHAGMMEQGLFRGEVSSFHYREYYEGLTASRGALAHCERAVALMRPPFASHKDGALLEP